MARPGPIPPTMGLLGAARLGDSGTRRSCLCVKDNGSARFGLDVMLLLLLAVLLLLLAVSLLLACMHEAEKALPRARRQAQPLRLRSRGAEVVVPYDFLTEGQTGAQQQGQGSAAGEPLPDEQVG